MFTSPHEPWNVPEHVDIDCAQLVSICFGLARENAGWIEIDQQRRRQLDRQQLAL